MKINAILPYNYTTVKKNNDVIFKRSAKIINTNNDGIIKIFTDLAKIPSPSLKETGVANWILSFCQKNKIKAVLDGYKNIKLNIPATDSLKSPLLFSAHMDVVGDDSPVNIVKDNDFIKTDGKRTLGADDKSGIAAALMLAKEFSKSPIKHGGLEMLFTRDEELGMTGIMNADLQDIKSKYVLVLDEAKLGRFDNTGADYITAILSLTTLFGGHSGINIGDKYRLNAVKLISELLYRIPQGVYYKDKSGVITSINHGTIIGGDIQNTATKIVEDKLVSDNYLEYFIKNAVTNVINTKAIAAISIRSSNKGKENELKGKIENIIEKFNQKYNGLASAKINYDELMPIFKTNEDKTLEKVYKEACKTIGLKPNIGTFHAGAETHIFINKKNKNNENFKPILLGIADIFDMHSSSERISISSLKKGYELIREMFLKFNMSQNK